MKIKKMECQRCSLNHIWHIQSHRKLQKFWELTKEIEHQPWDVRVKQNQWAPLAKERWRLHPITLIIPQRRGGSFTPVIQQLDAFLQDALPWKTSLVWCVQDQNVDSWDRQILLSFLSLPSWNMLCFHNISPPEILTIAFSVARWISSGLLQ